MLVCPSCKRRVITPGDVLYAPLDAVACCRICGRTARLDLFGRWIVSCLISVLLFAVLLLAGLFYSGHLFFVSILIVLAAYRLLCLLGLPFLTLEAVPGNPLDRMQSALMFGAMLAAAAILDGYMASRFE